MLMIRLCMTETMIMLVVRFILGKKTDSNHKIGLSHLEIHCGGGPYLANNKKQLREYEESKTNLIFTNGIYNINKLAWSCNRISNIFALFY